ncbi:MAG: ATP-binding protein [Vicinamibacterales bacterium]
MADHVTASRPRRDQLDVCARLSTAISRATGVAQIYDAALDALDEGLGVSRASILFFDPDGVMRFKAWRGLSAGYRAAVEGHTPWTSDTRDAAPIVVPDVGADSSLAAYLPTIRSEGIAAMAFVPLVTRERVIGKFMLYYPVAGGPAGDDVPLALIVAAQVAFAVARIQAEVQARESEARLRFALDAALMGTWDWDLRTNAVRWSENLEALHGLPPGTFDGTFASYAREIHPDDRSRVQASVERALAEGVAHDVEYRIVAPDGAVRWVEGKGRVEHVDGRPARMSGVCMMVTRRKEAEMARLTAAEEASRLKDEFLATLSHELRTPLGAILGWVQVLEAFGLDPQRVAQAVEVIGRNARLQAKLIEDILDVSRIITGKLQIERETVDVPHLIETAAATLEPTARARDVTLCVAAPPACAVLGDARRLHQVLANVLANAVTFTPEGGRVTLDTRLDGDALVVEVHDTGAGIDPDFLPFVFDRFRQADSRSTRRHGGLGLGLAIARSLVEQHGGQIGAASEGPGCGATITLRLPTRTSPAPAGAADAWREPAASPTLHGRTVLVVDDHRDSRDVIAAYLEPTGAAIVQCESATAALALAAGRAFDLVIADLAMPDVDGFELVTQLRAQRPDLRAIAVSAFARLEDRHKALVAGYSAYCAKPVDRARFLDTVRTVLRPDAGER